MSHDSVSRPETTEDLVRRLQDLKSDAKERTALQALASKMMSIFKDDKSYTHYYEAAAIAPFQDWLGYKNILLTLMDAVCTGTADGLVPRPELCEQFVSVLRLRESIDKGTSGNDLPLGQVMDSLQKRLDDSVHRASPAAQYLIVDTLGRVLDAMKDANTNGISREEHRDPLLKSLDGLRDSEEIRLAQAATYTYEVLRVIPDDEGPYKAALRHATTFVEAGAKIAGAVTTMDPSKLVSGIIDLADVPDLVSSMVTVIKTLSEVFDGIRDVPQDLKLQQMPKTWYIALRLADFYILNRRFSKLEELIRDVQCRSNIDFLSGLYAKLERAWITAGRGGNDTKDQDQSAINSIIEKLPSPEDHSDNLKHIDAWKQALQATIGLKPTSSPPKKESYLRRAKQKLVRNLRRKKYLRTVEYTVQADSATPSALLFQAWKMCPKAQLWYADAKLREYYLDNSEERLQITRISGTSLSMAQCYINLAIVEQKAGGGNASSLQLTLAQRLCVSDVPEGRSVILSKLFETRKCLDGSERAPRRLLIRGRAGVGKTTLCKKIMHSFTRQPVDAEFRTWTERYDRILWIPLRDLKRHEAHLGYSLAEFLKGEFFPRCSESAIFSTALGDHCSSDSANSRTLFLLDGLDEVSDQLDPEHKMSGFLQWLLRRPDAIITSRPGGSYVNVLVGMDCELETVGFDTEQVHDYVRCNVARADAKNNMQALLSKRPLLLSLMRIPVQLDAFCYIWDDPHAEMDGEILSSMASIYRLIERRIWHKDIPRLRKMHGSRYVTANSALELTLSEVDMLVNGETSFLGALAFAGLYHEVVNFELQECDDVRATWVGPKLEGQLSETLNSLSFLRTSGGSNNHRRTYNFVHLTYQEYFAAQYFVSRWIEGAHLLSATSKFGKRGSSNLSPIEFLRQNKYRSRFNIFWRFVTGALSSRNDEANLVNFFDKLEEQPRDILGLTHQRLVMHCLSEADPEHYMPCFDQRREKLREWAEWECKLQGVYSLNLVFQAEFPLLSYRTLLQNMDANIQRSMLQIVTDGDAARLQFMADEVTNNTALSNVFLKTIEEPYSTPLFVLGMLLPRFGNIFSTATNLDNNSRAELIQKIIVTAIVSNFPNTRAHCLRFLASGDESAVLQFAEKFDKKFGSLGNYRLISTSQPASSGDNEQLIACLQHTNISVRFVAFVALISQKPFPKAVSEALLLRLRDSENAMDETLRFLRRAFLPTELQPAIFPCIYHENDEIWACAAELLLRSSCSLSDSDFEALVDVLGSASEERKALVLDALLYFAESALPAGAIDLLHTWLKESSSGVCERVLAIFRRQRLSDTILETVGTLLQDSPNSSVRREAAQALKTSQTPLPSKVILQLGAALNERDIWVAINSFAALCSHGASVDGLVEAVRRVENSRLCEILSRHGMSRQGTAEMIEALLDKFRKCPPGDALRGKIIKYLQRAQANSIPREAVGAMYEELHIIMSQLDTRSNAERRKQFGESDEDVALFGMARFLSRQSTAPEDVQARLLLQLHDGSTFSSQVVAELLSHPSLLEPELISGLVKLARNDNFQVRLRALRILIGKANLPAKDLRQFAEILRQSICSADHIFWTTVILDDHPNDFSHFAIKSLHSLPDDEFSITLGCDNNFFQRAFYRWMNDNLWKNTMALYPDPDYDTHYIFDHPRGQKRIKKDDLPMSLEQYMEDDGAPKALGQE